MVCLRIQSVSGDTMNEKFELLHEAGKSVSPASGSIWKQATN
mgnify:CR=1 FL=1